MAEEVGTEEMLRRAMDANVRYYRALGQVTVDYLQALAGIWSSALPLDLGTFRMPPVKAALSPPDPAPASDAEPAPALVLEAEGGREARGVFMVENNLGRVVSTPVTVSAFRAEDGREVRPALRVEPAVVALEPGTSTLVCLVAEVTDELELGVGYRAEVDVPGLSHRGVPVVLRRAAVTTTQGDPAGPEPSGTAAGPGARAATAESPGPGEATAPKKGRSTTRRRGGSPGR